MTSTTDRSHERDLSEGNSIMVILINSFEVPAGREDEFLHAWQAIAAHLCTQPGYVRTRLHRAVSEAAAFAFVNVGEWESPHDFQAATTSEDFRRLAVGLRDFPAHPGLYRIEYDDRDDPVV
jgi:heme-degrading monooxygenase HmoA